MSEKSTMTNPKTFESPIAQKDGLLYINLKLSPLPYGQQLIVENEEGGKQRAMIAPTHMDTSGPRPHSGNTTYGRRTTKDTSCAFTSAWGEHSSHPSTMDVPSTQVSLRITERPSSDNEERKRSS